MARPRALPLAGVVSLLLSACIACSPASAPGGQDQPAQSFAGGGDGPVRVVAVGDVVCEPDEDAYPVTESTCQQAATADLTSRLDPTLIIGLGDLQYEEGTPAQFADAWNESWGRFADRIVTAPGNHEWRSDLSGWYETFGEEVPRTVTVGDWTIYLLDANCDHVDCTQQADWLSQQLAADDGRCQAVAWHQPRVSSGIGRNDSVAPLWEAAVEGRVDISLVAHDHLYERFTRLGADLEFDDVGVRQFIVGTGGKSLYPFSDTPQPGSESRVQDTFGVLELTLSAGAYAWRFVDVDDQVRDAGDDVCR